MKRATTTLLSIMLCVLAAFSQSSDEVTLTLIIDNVEHVTIDKYGEEITGLVSGENVLSVSPWTNLAITAKDGFTLESVTNAADEAQAITNHKSCSVFIMEEDETLTITTGEESVVNFTINVDDASVVSISDAQWNRVNITNGENHLSLSASQLPIGITSTNWQPFYLVTLDGEEVAYNWGYSIQPSEGSIIEIRTQYPDEDYAVTFTYAKPSNSDFFCAVYVDNSPIDFANGFSAKAGSKIALYYNTGLWYNTQEDSDYPLTVTLNGEKFEWFGSGSSFILSKPTVVEVAEASRKETIQVRLKIDDKDAVVVYRGSDSNKDIVAMHSGFNDITIGADDARIVIETSDDSYKILTASINDEDVDVNYYNYIELSDLQANDSIVIGTNSPNSGVNVDINDNRSYSVYTLTGIRLFDDATSEDINNLPAGLYIINGKKVIIK
jgi:hypothetical protein